jgi:hypothetical protein
MLINKDHDHAHQVRVMFRKPDGQRDSYYTGKVAEVTFGREQYQWHADRKKGHADPDGPAKTLTVSGEEGTSYDLRPASVTVLRGTLR